MADDAIDMDLSCSPPPSEDGLDIVSYVDTIEAVIASLDQGDGAMVSQTDEGHLWRFKYGSVDVYAQLTGEAETDTLTVWSPVLMLPAKDEPRLMKLLLEKNCNETLEARFGISGNQVLVISSRILKDISPAEISRLMTIVATIADDSDEALVSEFGMS
ncbi:YbjN domain-containing protein [Phormidium sp. FACHB-322]|uniref:YbjN domain-containing protein n=2 Tax=Cyanophyceae TaxID=3028117 RepID=UPI0016863B24|nr:MULTISPECIES: YbjN domain-containing protein [Cyanophyceae]MBD1918780.1 YbjN domain-containing protein [Phormidium sp. FACHB-77]MBD2033377.1 YbjN domain-containing protein [Phormidium sp. FACHB-322]MBD2053690.1 YbjN domain-containing protein [Leptolyngbya sp. FACHB-60]